MNKMTQRLLASTVAVLLAGTSIAATAGGPGACDHGSKGYRAENMHQHMGAKMAKREADLKTALKLTSTQEAAWAAFTNAMKPSTSEGKTRPIREEMGKLTTPQRMEKMQSLKIERDALMSKRMEATKTFYATLTPDQQKAFDENAHAKGGHGNRGHGGRGKHHG